ncbi:MurR/RpiR family transcriptional regulator [Falsiroseomonas oryzae]|uniref:MurR/RpiR family transcriptional regulator n=1 Tax=Falsiroseomonas oryzae TaxID=2766473 RepID=UPI0022EA3A42|nr:MurR/RpiR family transcriptional regulator [Roseomonas sp. MO-31]
MSGAVPLVRLLAAREAELPPSQRALARHVLANYQSVAFSTVADLARAAGVSEATVVRLANALGFSGYPALQKEIRRIVRADLKGTERFHLLERQRPQRGGTLERVLAEELDNLAHLRGTVDAAAVRQAAAALRRARRILVVGARGAAPLAFHLWFALDKLGLDPARSLAADTEATDRLSRMDRRDVVVVIGFPRYLRAKVRLLELAGRLGVTRIVVTDSPFSALKGEIGLHAPAESGSFVAYHAAPLVLLNALVEEVAAADRQATMAALQAFEATAEAQSYFQPP